MVKIELEGPGGEVIEAAGVELKGWCLSEDGGPKLTVRLGDRSVKYNRVDRPDVTARFPGVPSFGFSYVISEEDCVHLGGKVELRLSMGAVTIDKTFRCGEAVAAQARDWASKKAAKRAWCLSVLRCPICRSDRPVADESGDLRCPACRARLKQKTSALNLLPPELYKRFHLKPTSNVSSHPYPPPAVELIEEARRAGGKVLDCGAGLRRAQDETVVNLEIADYASTDVLAVGQSLPFADASFDAALSLAVLEHVDDPFACAAELTRVVKPGGKIFCVVPFMQHEHGYPNHFFNMTRQGMLKMFEGRTRLLHHTVPTYGAPIYALCALVDEYSGQLPPEVSAEFLQLTLGDIKRLRKEQFWQKSYVRELSEEGNWMMAAVTAAVFERTEASFSARKAIPVVPQLPDFEGVSRKLAKLRRDPAAFFADAKLKPLRRLKTLFR